MRTLVSYSRTTPMQTEEKTIVHPFKTKVNNMYSSRIPKPSVAPISDPKVEEKGKIEEMEMMDDAPPHLDIDMDEADESVVDNMSHESHQSYSMSHRSTTPTSPSFVQSKGQFVPAPSTMIPYSYEEDKDLLPLEDRFPFLKDDRKRTRKLLSPDQTRILEAILERTVYPSTPLREAVARQLGIPPRKVQIWFQNKRQGRRRQSVTEGSAESNGSPTKTPTSATNESPFERARRHDSRERCLEIQSVADDYRLAVLRDEQGRQFAELRLGAAYRDGEQHPAPCVSIMDYSSDVDVHHPSSDLPNGNALGVHSAPQVRSYSWHSTPRQHVGFGAQAPYGAGMRRVTNLSDSGMTFTNARGAVSAHPMYAHHQVRSHPYIPRTDPSDHHQHYHARQWPQNAHGTDYMTSRPINTAHVRQPLYHSSSYGALRQHPSMHASPPYANRFSNHPSPAHESYSKSGSRRSPSSLTQSYDYHDLTRRSMPPHDRQMMQRRSTVGEARSTSPAVQYGVSNRNEAPHAAQRPSMETSRHSDSELSVRAQQNGETRKNEGTHNDSSTSTSQAYALKSSPAGDQRQNVLPPPVSKRVVLMNPPTSKHTLGADADDVTTAQDKERPFSSSADTLIARPQPTPLRSRSSSTVETSSSLNVRANDAQQVPSSVCLPPINTLCLSKGHERSPSTSPGTGPLSKQCETVMGDRRRKALPSIAELIRD